LTYAQTIARDIAAAVAIEESLTAFARYDRAKSEVEVDVGPCFLFCSIDCCHTLAVRRWPWPRRRSYLTSSANGQQPTANDSTDERERHGDQQEADDGQRDVERLHRRAVHVNVLPALAEEVLQVFDSSTHRGDLLFDIGVHH